MTAQTYLPGGALPAPEPMNDGLDAPFWDGLNDGELRLQKCVPCDAFQWGPEWICHRCLGEDLEWVAVEPAGTIYSWERVWHAVTPALAEAVPYIAVLVEDALPKTPSEKVRKSALREDGVTEDTYDDTRRSAGKEAVL